MWPIIKCSSQIDVGPVMDAWPHLVCGVLGGWLVKDWSASKDPPFGPTCSCHCEVPSIEDDPGFSLYSRPLFPICQVRVVRFYQSCSPPPPPRLAVLLLLLPL